MFRGIPAWGRAGQRVTPLVEVHLGQISPSDPSWGAPKTTGKLKKKKLKKKKAEILRDGKCSPRRGAGSAVRSGRSRGASPGERGGDGAALPAPKPTGNSFAFAGSWFLPCFRSDHAVHTWAGEGEGCGRIVRGRLLCGRARWENILFFFFLPLWWEKILHPPEAVC